MSIDHIKKGDSLENKQLIIINSGERDDETQDTNSFTYTFDQPIKRVSKIDVLYSKIPKSFYNLNNDNATMSITTETFTSTKTYDLVVDDNELKDNKILATNIIDGTVIKTNLLSCNNNVDITKIISKDIFLYVCGIFYNDIIDFKEFTGNTSNKNLSNTGMNDMFVAKYSIDQEMLMRFKIGGYGIDDNINISVSDYISVSGTFKSFVLNFFNKSDSIKYSMLSDGNVTGFLSKYTLDGEFEWSIKIAGVNKNSSPILNISDPINKHIYVSGSFNMNLKFYNKNSNINDLENTTILYDGNGSTDIFIAQYSYTGILNWVSVISGGCIVKSIAINSVTNQVMLGIEYFQTMYFKQKYTIITSNTNIVIGNSLNCLGLQNLAIVEFDINSNNIYRMRIGGSNFDSDIRIDVNNNILAVSGLYNSNPLGIYNTSDELIKYIDNNNNNNVNNIFIITYDLSNNKSYKWCTTIYDTNNIIGYLDISITNIGEIILLGNYSALLKFNDVNGLQVGYDLKNNATNTNTFIAKYNSVGIFKYRSFINNIDSRYSSIGSSIDAHSNNIYIVGKFNAASIELYNSDNSLHSSLTKKTSDIYNGYVISYVNNINNFDIDVKTLNKRIISRTLSGTDINYTININAFSQQLGLNKSTLFNAMIFGEPIIWKSLDINDSNNNLIIEFNIGNKIKKIFDKYIITFSISKDQFGPYRPYNLVFELNRIINTKLLQQTYFNYTNTRDVIKYDSYKNIFYIMFPIIGTFKLINTPGQLLYGPTCLNLPNTLSKHCVIADSNLSDEPYIEVSDNSKITLKIKEQNVEDRLINAKFHDVFPNIAKGSGTLNIQGINNKKIELIPGDYSDDITKDIQINDTIEFDAPWINVDKNKVTFTAPLEWTDIASNFDNKILTAIVNNGNIYISDSYGESWIMKESVRSWQSIAISQSGIYQTAVAYNDQIYISNDTGKTWNIKESIRKWYDVSISRNYNLDDGKHQSAVNRGGYIYVSHDYGETWFSKCEKQDWISIDINKDGTIQVAVIFNGSIWYSVNSGNTWSEMSESINAWKSVCMTNDASTISVITEIDYVYYYTYNNNAVNYVSHKRIANGKKLCKISIAKNTPLIQSVISNTGSIYITFDSGLSWKSNNTEENWIGIALSDEGNNQMAVVNNGGIYKLIYTLSNSWIELVDSNTWLDIAMSSDGIKQIAIQRDGQLGPEGTGSLWQSNDSGTTWKKSNITYLPTHANRQTGIAMSSDGKYRYYSSGSGIVRSSDYGDTWVYKSMTIGLSTVNCIGIAVSVDGRHVTVGNYAGRIRTSNDFGITFYIRGPENIGSQSVSMNFDGSLQMIVGNISGNSGKIFISNDYWVTTAMQPTEEFIINKQRWNTGAMSLDGNLLMACSYGSTLCISYNRGVTWQVHSYFTPEVVNKFALSFDGTIIVVIRQNKPLYISKDKGLTFYEKEIVRTYQSVAMSLYGDHICAVVNGGSIFRSNNYGDNWDIKNIIFNELFDNQWEALSISRNGKYIVACSAFNKMHISNDYGKSFIKINGTNKLWTSAAISDDGKKIVGLYTLGGTFTSGVQTSWDGGYNFYTTDPSSSITAYVFAMDIAMSSDGSVTIFTGVTSGTSADRNIFISTATSPPLFGFGVVYDNSWAYDLTAELISAGKKFPCIAMSADGKIRYAGSAQTPNGSSTAGTLMKWVSSTLNSKISAPLYDKWFDTGLNQEVLILSCSDDGSQVTIGIPNYQLRYSNDYGANFSTFRGPRIISNTYSQKLKSSGNGLVQSCIANNKIYISYDNWNTYIPQTHGIDRNWRSLAISFDGQHIIAGVSPGGLYQSFNKGDTFGIQTNNRDACKVSLNNTGETQIVISSGREVYTSKTSGNTWISDGYTNTWADIAVSKNYNSAVAVPYYGSLYVNNIDNSGWQPGTIITNNQLSPDLNCVYSVAYVPVKDIIIESLGCYITKTSPTDTIYIGIYDTLGSTLLQQTTVSPSSIGLISSNIFTALTLIKGNRYWISIKSKNCDSKFEFETIPITNSWVRYYNNSNIVGLPADISSTSTDGVRSPLIKLGNSNIFTSQTNNIEWTSCTISSDGRCRIATVNNGPIYISYESILGNPIDINTIWTKTNAINNIWKSCAVNIVGTSYIISAVSKNGNIYISNDLGISWTNIINNNTNRNWQSISKISSNVNNLFVASVLGGNIYKINLDGVTYNIISINDNNKQWQCVVSSVDGVYYTAVALNDYIYTSSDSGNTWISRGPIKNWISVSMNDSGSKQVAISSDGIIYYSNDYGISWGIQISMKELRSIALNSFGSIQAVVEQGGQILISNDYGISWAVKEKSQAWRSIDCDIKGNNMAAVAYDSMHIYSSTDSGVSWNATLADPGTTKFKFIDVAISYNYNDSVKVVIILAAAVNERLFLKNETSFDRVGPSLEWTGVAISTYSGNIQYAIANNSKIYKSVDYGKTWNVLESSPILAWTSIDTSYIGNYVTAVATNNKIYTSFDFGVTWVARDSDRYWNNITISADGLKQLATVDYGKVYASTDYGLNWIPLENSRNWRSVAITDIGEKQIACTSDSVLFHSFNLNERIRLNIETINSDNLIIDKAYSRETLNNNLLPLVNYNLSTASNFTTTRTTNIKARDIFIPSGNYTPETLVDAINNLIYNIDSTWKTPKKYGFTYDPVTKKISFVSKISGDGIIVSTNLLKKMGFADMNNIITADKVITASNMINKDISGSSNIFIKSNVIGDLRKNKTAFSTNKKLENIISPLVFNELTNNYEIPFPIEIFLNKKATLDYVDIQIVDESGRIVNLNGNDVQVNFYLYLS